MATRNTTIRDKHRRIIARDQPPCYWCGCELIYDTTDPDDDQAHLDPRAFTVDHVIPLARGGPDTIDNKVPSCRACNRDKSDKLPNNGVFITWRTWTP